MAAGRVELSLLGQTLTVRTEASPEYVRRLAAYLEERVTELRTAGIKDPMASLTLAALDITDELFRVREDKTRQEGDVDTRLGALVEILDRLAARRRRQPKPERCRGRRGLMLLAAAPAAYCTGQRVPTTSGAPYYPNGQRVVDGFGKEYYPNGTRIVNDNGDEALSSKRSQREELLFPQRRRRAASGKPLRAASRRASGRRSGSDESLPARRHDPRPPGRRRTVSTSSTSWAAPSTCAPSATSSPPARAVLTAGGRSDGRAQLDRGSIAAIYSSGTADVTMPRWRPTGCGCARSARTTSTPTRRSAPTPR